MRKGFTIVELIVTITILGIVSTLGFVAYIDYLTSVRDSSRLEQISRLYNAFELHSTRINIPLSNQTHQIVYSWSLIWNQWDIDLAVREEIWYFDGWIDPKSKDPFSYFVSPNRKDIQILGFLENKGDFEFITNWSSVESSYNWLYPYIYGAWLGVLTDNPTQSPLHLLDIHKDVSKIDMSSYTWSSTAYIDSDTLLSGSWEIFVSLVPSTNCKKILELSPWLPSGVYSINPSWINIFEAYCDMDIDGGWWTLVWRSSDSAVPWDFWWMIEYGDPRTDDDKYSLWQQSQYLNFSEIMLTSYTTEKNIQYAFSFEVDSSYIQDTSRHDSHSASVDGSCRELVPDPDITPWNSSCDRREAWSWFPHNYWGNVSYKGSETKSWFRDEGFFFNYYNWPTSSWEVHRIWWLRGNSDGFIFSTNVNLWTDMPKNPWMIFVR